MKRVLILGGGFGGIATARRFLSQLVDRRVERSPEAGLMDRVVRPDLLDSLAGLPADQRVAIVMASRGASGREIAQAIGRSEAATRRASALRTATWRSALISRATSARVQTATPTSTRITRRFARKILSARRIDSITVARHPDLTGSPRGSRAVPANCASHRTDCGPRRPWVCWPTWGPTRSRTSRRRSPTSTCTRPIGP